MSYRPERNWIERAAVRLGVIKGDAPSTGSEPPPRDPAAPLQRYPDPDQWDDVVELDPKAWPTRAESKHYRLVPTVCFNCESGCGLLAYVDKQTGKIRKLEGNPVHTGSRGRNCAKGPATINQVNDPDRILSPMKRVGPRGSGKWEAVSWEDALADIGGRIRKALQENRHDEIMYHVGRPGSEGFIDRVLKAWGVDGHNSHTNVCSAGARLGYALWCGHDRPSPDYVNTRFMLELNAHFESGHYFNPHAQRIRESMGRGAKMAVVDPRLSNTASAADYWLPTRPGTESALLLSLANVILNEGLYDRKFIERWVNWKEYLQARNAKGGTAVSAVSSQAESSTSTTSALTIETFIAALKQDYARFTPEFAESECGVPASRVVEVARLIGQAGSRFASHTWRGAASAHLGGWQVSRCLFFLHVLTGSVGTEGGCSPSNWHKYKVNLIDPPPPTSRWNGLSWPHEFPLSHYEMCFLLPHLLLDGRGKLDVYFTRVFNPVWSHPDGFVWMQALRDESKIGMHIALTPTWNETALFADYVLPMGHGPERHDITTYETHTSSWIAFRQPVQRVAAEADGQTIADTRDTNPGQVWEEDEFWIALCWAIDPDGSLGIRRYFESKQSPGEKLSVDEYYAYLFDHVKGLPEVAQKQNLTPLAYMRKYGAFEVDHNVLNRHERRLSPEQLEGTAIEAGTGIVRKNGSAVGVEIAGVAVEGFGTPSRKLEFYSPMMAEWGWPEYATPTYIASHIWKESDTPAEPRTADLEPPEFCLLPTFRLPTLIHSRSGAAKWLNEISHRNPIWVHPRDAKRLGIRHTGDLARVTTEIGHFVDKVWITEAIRPGVVACSHHLGRWRRDEDPPNARWSSAVVRLDDLGQGQFRMRHEHGVEPFESSDPDSARIWWRDGGVPQNLTHAVHPDPISGMHAWHQRVRVEPAHAEDRYGDVVVDTGKSMRVFYEWLKKTRTDAIDRTGLRRPLCLNRPLRPTDDAYCIGK